MHERNLLLAMIAGKVIPMASSIFLLGETQKNKGEIVGHVIDPVNHNPNLNFPC